MKLKIDKTRVTEGDVVTVKWDAGRAGEVSGTTIVIDNGFRKAEIPVERSGEKKFRLNRSNGQTVIYVTAMADGKSVRAEQRVRVKSAPKFDSYTTVGTNKLAEFFRRIFGRFGRGGSYSQRGKFCSGGNSLWTRIKYGWQGIPSNKKHSWVMLGVLFVTFVLAIFDIKFAFYGLGILTIYLIWTLL